MKTPAQWMFKYPELLSKELIAEIQRDAREGMVPVEDVKPLIGKWIPPKVLADAIAKYPNLFTK